MESLASSSHKRAPKNSNPSYSFTNLYFAAKLSDLITDERAEKMASLFFMFFSLQNDSTKFIAPDLIAYSWTYRLLVLALVINERADLLTSSLG